MLWVRQTTGFRPPRGPAPAGGVQAARNSTCEKPYRNEVMCGYLLFKVFRTCLLATCGSRRTATARRPTSNATLFLAPGSMTPPVRGPRQRQPGRSAGIVESAGVSRPGDCLVVWKLDRLGRSLPHLLATVNGLKDARGVPVLHRTDGYHQPARRISVLCVRRVGAVRAGPHASASRRACRGPPSRPAGGRPVAIDAEKLAAVVAALEAGATKAAVCRTFGIKRST